MRILVLTQTVHKDDPVLGFFHRWLQAFAANFERVTVICLEVGQYNLPGVKVLSLGKESGVPNLDKLGRFYKYLWQERGNYDVVFVHMNQEYVLLGWKLWWIMGKRIYLWRNHAKGNFLTRLAALVSHKVFYTSPSSYTARFANSVQMPVGIDTNFFTPDPSVERRAKSILFLGRIAPVKKVLEFIDWLLEHDFNSATIAGSALPQDKEYEALVKEEVRKLGLSEKVRFVGAVNQEEARRLYRSHETYVNLTPAGSMDKTILEAAACGCKLVVHNPDFDAKLTPENQSLKALVDKLNIELSS